MMEMAVVMMTMMKMMIVIVTVMIKIMTVTTEILTTTEKLGFVARPYSKHLNAICSRREKERKEEKSGERNWRRNKLTVLMHNFSSLRNFSLS